MLLLPQLSFTFQEKVPGKHIIVRTMCRVGLHDQKLEAIGNMQKI